MTLYLIPPVKFNSKFDAVSCFFDYKGKILLLQRQKNKPQPNTWGVPTGKVNPKEDKLEALIREVKEETNINIAKQNAVSAGRFYVRYKEYDFIYWPFKIAFKEKPHIQINSIEHQKYDWLTPKDALKLNLIQDMDQCIKRFYNIN